MTKEECRLISEALGRLKESFENYTDALNRENEMLLGVIGYPNSLTSEEDYKQEDYKH